MRDIEADALRVEARQYVVAGMCDRVELINAALRADGRDEVDVPDASPATRAKRTSTQAATRRKRTAS